MLPIIMGLYLEKICGKINKNENEVKNENEMIIFDFETINDWNDNAVIEFYTALHFEQSIIELWILLKLSF